MPDSKEALVNKGSAASGTGGKMQRIFQVDLVLGRSFVYREERGTDESCSNAEKGCRKLDKIRLATAIKLFFSKYTSFRW